MDRSALLAELLKIQEEERYLPEERLLKLADDSKVPIAKINETATFYSFLKRKKSGKCTIRVCNSPTCFIHKSKKIFDFFNKLLGIAPGETSKDGKFSLEITSCVGCCDHAPAAMIDDQLHTDLSEAKIKQLLEKCK